MSRYHLHSYEMGVPLIVQPKAAATLIADNLSMNILNLRLLVNRELQHRCMYSLQVQKPGQALE